MFSISAQSQRPAAASPHLDSTVVLIRTLLDAQGDPACSAEELQEELDDAVKSYVGQGAGAQSRADQLLAASGCPGVTVSSIARNPARAARLAGDKALLVESVQEALQDATADTLQDPLDRLEAAPSHPAALPAGPDLVAGLPVPAAPGASSPATVQVTPELVAQLAQAIQAMGLAAAAPPAEATPATPATPAEAPPNAGRPAAAAPIPVAQRAPETTAPRPAGQRAPETTAPMPAAHPQRAPTAARNNPPVAPASPGQESLTQRVDRLMPLNNFTEAVGPLRTLVAQQPADSTRRAQLATCLRGLDLHAEAEPHMRWLLQRSPRNTRLQMQLSTTLVKQSKFDEAHAVSSTAVRTAADGDLPALFDQLFRIQDGLKAPEAKRAAQAALAANPRSAACLFKLGRLYNLQEKFAKAAPLLRKAVQLAPESAQYRAELGISLDKVKSKREIQERLDLLNAGLRDDPKNHRYNWAVLLTLDSWTPEPHPEAAPAARMIRKYVDDNVRANWTLAKLEDSDEARLPYLRRAKTWEEYISLRKLTDCLVRVGRFDEAEPLLRQMVTHPFAFTQPGDTTVRRDLARIELAKGLIARNQLAEAERFCKATSFFLRWSTEVSELLTQIKERRGQAAGG